MGMLVNGSWVDSDDLVRSGSYVRQTSELADPFELAAGANGSEPRYWLIASHSCPWSHGVTITRAFHQIERQIGLHIAHGPRHEGYAIDGGAPWTVPGPGTQITHLHQLYRLSDRAFTGRSTVPVLWDAQRATILSNDSRRMLRAVNQFGRDFGDNHFDLVPEALLGAIDAMNTWLYEGLNNAVYRAGFAESQEAYDKAVADVFSTLQELDDRLSRQRYLLGEAITESDWRLFPTLVRFDSIYATLHRCQARRLTDYSALWAYARDLYAWPGIAETVQFDAILRGSYLNDTSNNPHRIVPVQPAAEWTAPHDRAGVGAARIRLNSGETIGPERPNRPLS